MTIDLPSLETTEPSERATGDLYLRLRLKGSGGRNGTGAIAAVLRLETVQEVLSVPVDRITPIPYMPECTFGLLNQRSRIIWVVDLSQMLELGTIDRNRQLYSIAIVRNGNSPLALVVEEIKSVFRFPSELMQSPVGTVEPGLVPYLQGCISYEEEMLWVLEPSSIINSPLLGSELSLSRHSVSI
jgi:positive phototaxis protein PixI